MRIAFALLLSCSFAHGVACPTGQTKDQAALLRIEQSWLTAQEQHDATTLGCILADEFEEADFNGSLIDRATMLASAAKPSNSNATLSCRTCMLTSTVTPLMSVALLLEA